MIKIHPLADIQSKKVGDGTSIWQFCVVLANAEIGKNCNICAQVFIENEVIIGDDVTIKSGVQLWDGIKVGNKVFIGPNVTFTNDLIPRSKSPNWKLVRTIIEEGASVGANATIIGGVKIGEYALIGAGTVVTKDIPPYTLWYGNPAKQKGYVTREGIILDMNKKDKSGVVHQID